MKIPKFIKPFYLEYVWSKTKVSFQKSDIYLNSNICGRFEVVRHSERRAVKVYPSDISVDNVIYVERFKLYDKLNCYLGIYDTKKDAAKALFYKIHSDGDDIKVSDRVKQFQKIINKY